MRLRASLSLSVFFICNARSQDNIDCKLDEKGADYNGQVSVTESGRTCQYWNTNQPHDLSKDRKNIAKFLNIDINEYQHNYCRNPGGAVERPICYTTDPSVRWDYCDIPTCVAVVEESSPVPSIKIVTDNKDDELNEFMEDYDYFESQEEMKVKKSYINFDCYKPSDKGINYIGESSKSLSGAPCQSWSENSPTKLNKYAKHFSKKYSINIRDYPKNHCRNPGGHYTRPMCVTGQGKKKIELCEVPICDKEAVEIPAKSSNLGDSPGNLEEVDVWSHNGIEDDEWVVRVSDEERALCGQIDPIVDCYDQDINNACYKPAVDPKNFMMCQNGLAIGKPCPSNLHWNHKDLSCDWPMNIN